MYSIVRLSVKIRVFCARSNAILAIVHLFLCHEEFEIHIMSYHKWNTHTLITKYSTKRLHVQLVCRCGSLMEKFRFVASALSNFIYCSLDPALITPMNYELYSTRSK